MRTTDRSSGDFADGGARAAHRLIDRIDLDATRARVWPRRIVNAFGDAARVVMLCCCTADAMLVETVVNLPIVRAIEEISSTDRLVAPWMAVNLLARCRRWRARSDWRAS